MRPRPTKLVERSVIERPRGCSWVPAPFAVEKRAYCTSITQGGNASRPGCCYQAMLARDLNLDYANFGLAGKGRCEREVAEFQSEVEQLFCEYVLSPLPE